MFLLILFFIATLFNVYISRKCLISNPSRNGGRDGHKADSLPLESRRDHAKTHGFYRFFVFEAAIILIALNLNRWFVDWNSWHQLISWVLLSIGAFIVIYAVYLMKSIGKPQKVDEDSSTFKYENTSVLIKSGLFKYIRHPMYSSLLFLIWGVFFKSVGLFDFIIAIIGTYFLVKTAETEEKENVERFGKEYKEYMSGTKKFLPGIF